MAKLAQQNRYGASFMLAITLHAIVLGFLIFTFNRAVSHPPVMVNLLKNPQNQTKPIKAGVVDKRAIDQAIQRQALEEKLRQDKLLEEQRLAEQKQQEAEQAKKALELEKIQRVAAEKARVEKEAAAKKEQAKKQELAKKQEILKKQEAKQKEQKLAAEKKLADKKLAEKKLTDQKLAEKQAAGIKADQDRLQAEHNLMLQSEVERYKAQIAAAIEDNRTLTAVFTGNLVCRVRISLLPTGDIANIRIIQSSGNPNYDEMSTQAIHKAAPFALPQDHELFEQLREIVLSFKNGEQSVDA